MPTVLAKLNRPFLVILAVGALAAGVRFTGLSRPEKLVFDEVYYAKDGCLYAGGSLDTCMIKDDGEVYWVEQRDEVGSWVHPPLGKWLISLGINQFGMTPFGWRVASATVGTLSVVFTAMIAWLLFRSTLWTAATGLLLATESLHVVQSRLALLDIFLAFWVTLGFLFLILDRDAKQRHPKRIVRPWLVLCGVAMGAASATKWSGAFALAGAGTLALVWEINRLRDHPQDEQRRSDLPALLANLLVAFAIVPAFVYVASFARFWSLHGIDATGLRDWIDLHKAAADWHFGLSRFKMSGDHFVLGDDGHKVLTHPYSSVPWSWPLLLRPVNVDYTDPGTHLLSIGNPVVFWGSIITVPALVYAQIRKRIRNWAAGFIALAVLCQYIPWYFKASRVQFLFYMTPIVPFMVLALVYCLRWMANYRPPGARAQPFAPLAAGIILASVAMFVFFYPILTDVPLSHAAWELRMWLPTWV